MEIREIRPEEYDTVATLTVEAYRPFGIVDGGYDRELADVATRARQATVVVAVDGDEVLGGYTYVPPGDNPLREHDEDDQASIRMLAVADGARRRGVGRALSTDAIERAREDGASGLILHSSVHMTAAHRMYEGLGFVLDDELAWEPEPGVALIGYRLVDLDVAR